MTRRIHALVILIALAMIANIPNISLAQYGQPTQAPSSQTARQAPQPVGGIATVIGVDQPENCLRIRSGPGNSYDIIGCANMGQQLRITGIWTANDWAQTADNGWVYGPEIQTDLRPPRAAYSGVSSYAGAEEWYPNESVDYYDDAYLPDYGYQTFWYGGVPVFLYNLNVWNRFHPWWWHRHRGQRVWNQDPRFRANANVRANVRTGTGTNFGTRTAPSVVTNRSNVSALNTARLNANSLRLNTNRSNGSSLSTARLNPNALRLNTTRSLPSSTIRARSSNVTSSGQNFSALKSFRTNNVGVRNFSTTGLRSFSNAGVKSFSTPRVSPNISGFSNIGSNMATGSGVRRR